MWFKVGDVGDFYSIEELADFTTPRELDDFYDAATPVADSERPQYTLHSPATPGPIVSAANGLVWDLASRGLRALFLIGLAAGAVSLALAQLPWRALLPSSGDNNSALVLPDDRADGDSADAQRRRVARNRSGKRRAARATRRKARRRNGKRNSRMMPGKRSKAARHRSAP